MGCWLFDIASWIVAIHCDMIRYDTIRYDTIIMYQIEREIMCVRIDFVLFIITIIIFWTDRNILMEEEIPFWERERKKWVKERGLICILLCVELNVASRNHRCYCYVVVFVERRHDTAALLLLLQYSNEINSQFSFFFYFSSFFHFSHLFLITKRRKFNYL